METNITIIPCKHGYAAIKGDLSICRISGLAYHQHRTHGRGSWGVSPRQALERLAEIANLHGETVRVSVTAPDWARNGLRDRFPNA